MKEEMPASVSVVPRIILDATKAFNAPRFIGIKQDEHSEKPFLIVTMDYCRRFRTEAAALRWWGARIDPSRKDLL